ncbi:unnamed protein product, partial [Cladocopium goreaui]
MAEEEPQAQKFSPKKRKVLAASVGPVVNFRVDFYAEKGSLFYRQFEEDLLYTVTVATTLRRPNPLFQAAEMFVKFIQEAAPDGYSRSVEELGVEGQMVLKAPKTAPYPVTLFVGGGVDNVAAGLYLMECFLRWRFNLADCKNVVQLPEVRVATSSTDAAVHQAILSWIESAGDFVRGTVEECAKDLSLIAPPGFAHAQISVVDNATDREHLQLKLVGAGSAIAAALTGWSGEWKLNGAPCEPFAEGSQYERVSSK